MTAERYKFAYVVKSAGEIPRPSGKVSSVLFVGGSPQRGFTRTQHVLDSAYVLPARPLRAISAAIQPVIAPRGGRASGSGRTYIDGIEPAGRTSVGKGKRGV